VLGSTWCAPGVLADLPAGSSRTDELILDRGLGKLPGARVVRATVALDVNCMLDARPVCAPMLTVKRVVWSGDNATHTRPIDPVTLLSQLDVRFPFTDFMPYPKEDGCRASLPPQSYSAHTLAGLQPRSQLALPVSVVLLFPSAKARRRAQESVMTAQACPAFAATLAEVPQAGWISQRNVMVLSTDPDTLPEVQAAIEAAIQEGN
jgi:hypothetical protein